LYVSASSTPPPSPQPLQMYGTLKGLEQSMNPQLMKYACETDGSIALARRENRHRLFSMYPHMPVSFCLAAQTFLGENYWEDI
jgi:hypothetical protein